MTTEELSMTMDMTVAVQGLVNLFLNMDRRSREMFIKLLVVKMEEQELDLILEVVDMRNQNNNDFNILNVKEDDVKIEPDHNYETETSDKNYEDKKMDFDNEGSLFTLKDDLSIDSQIPTYTSNNFNLKNQMETSTTEIKCSYCVQSFFNKKDFKKHSTIHPEYKIEGKPFCCDICPKSFYTITELKRHKNKHDGIKPFLCDQCPHASTSKSHLKEHKLGCHPENGPEEMLKMFVCDICSKSFGTNERLKIHIHRQHVKNDVFSCDQCSYATSHVTSMKNHKRTHTGERPYVCHICSKTFTQPQHLNRHIKGVHMGEKTNKPYTGYLGVKNFLCDICSTAFSTPQTLKIHKESIHEGIKYACDQCGYKVTDKRNLARHVAAIHDGIKYADKQECLCQECGYKAPTKQCLKNHEELVHLGIRYECSQCDHKATTKSNLKQHVEYAHESIQHDCKECDFTTMKKWAFHKHMTNHRKAHAQNQNSPFGMTVN